MIRTHPEPILREVSAPVEPDEATGSIRCTQCGRRYPITDGIPVMLPPGQESA